ncbi:MAG: hypothetical protein ACXVWZ_10770 [Nocardioides sp.]
MSTTTSTTTSSTLIQDLDALHADFVAGVNGAVEDGDLLRAVELAQAYDVEATRMVAEREGLTHLLPLRPRTAA